MVILLLLIKPPVLLVLLVNIQPTEAIVLSVHQEQSVIQLLNVSVLRVEQDFYQILQEQFVNLVPLDHQDVLWESLVLVVMVQMELIALHVQQVNTRRILEEIVLFVLLEQSAIRVLNVNAFLVQLELNQMQH